MKRNLLSLVLGLTVGCEPAPVEVIDPPIPQVLEEPSFAGCSVTTLGDLDANGSAESEDLKVYDEKGRLIYSFHDQINDFMPGQAHSYVYNDLDQLVLVEGDWMADGQVDWVVEHTYDSRGNRTRTESSQDFIGNAVQVMTYSDEDQLIRWEIDGDGDGVFDSQIDYAYNDSDPWFERVVTDLNEGVVQQVERRNFDANQRLTRRTVDLGDNGTVDQFEEYTYDSQGRLWTESHEVTGDNLVDGSLMYMYDTHGRVVETLHFRGALEEQFGMTTSSYNEDGWLILQSYDYGMDEVPDALTTVEYDCT